MNKPETLSAVRGADSGAAPCSASYALFKHMSDTYQLTLLETELQEIMDAVNQCERMNVCNWKQNESHGYWEGGCGLAWEFTTGTPEANGFWCCPRCGRRINTPNDQAHRSAPTADVERKETHE